MSVTASVLCLDCKSYAPDPGDCGHIGYPSLEDEDASVDDFASFEYIYRGFAAIGIKLLTLDQIRSWLAVHATHRVQLAYEGEPVGRARKPLRRGTLKEPIEARAYERSFVETSCARCKSTFRTARSLLLTRCEQTLTREQVAQFVERVLEVEDLNFYRTFDLLDPGGSDRNELASFLRKHARHSAVLRTVSGESWLAGPVAPGSGAMVDRHTEPLASAARVLPRVSLPPPLTLIWSYEGAIKAPVLVSDDLTLTLAGKREYAVAVGDDGREKWRSQAFPAHALWDMHLVGTVLWLPVYVKQADGSGMYELWAIDRDTGRAARMVEGAPTVATFVDATRFIGRRYRPANRKIETVGLFSADANAAAVWETEVASEPLRGGFANEIAVEGERLFVTHGPDVVAMDLSSGREIWRSGLSQYGRPWAGGDHLRLTVAEGTVVYGLQSSLHALSSETGAVRWTRTTDAFLYRAHYGESLFLAGVYVFSGGEHERVCMRLSVESGEQVFRVVAGSDTWQGAPQPPPRFSTVPRPTDECVYLGDVDGRLWALSAVTGKPLWMQGLHGKSGVERIVVANDRLRVADHSGRISCFARERGSA